MTLGEFLGKLKEVWGRLWEFLWETRRGLGENVGHFEENS